MSFKKFAFAAVASLALIGSAGAYWDPNTPVNESFPNGPAYKETAVAPGAMAYAQDRPVMRSAWSARAEMWAPEAGAYPQNREHNGAY